MRLSRAALIAVLASSVAGAAGAAAPTPTEPIQPVPLSHGQDPVRADLGQRLFNEPRLSANDKVSCASCHDVGRGGADSHDLSIGFSGKRTGVNAPTVLNAALNFRQFWDGRAGTLEEQVDSVVRNPVEMGSAWPDVLAKLARDAGYKAAFAAIYKDGITQANVQNAIATYERTLITPRSRFDNYLRGDRTALTDLEKAGYTKFKQYGCVACHQGINVGGNMFQKFGVMGDYFAARGNATPADLGRQRVTGDPADAHVFKVPSLRNVVLTAPYFHDGSAKTLEEAVDVMFKYQLGRAASREDKQAIVRFLNTLTGEPAGTPK